MDKAEEKRKAKEIERLDNKYTLTFTKAELIEIFHAIAADEAEKPRKYGIAVGAILFNVMKMIQPLIVVETNIPVKEEPKLDLGDKVVN